MECCLSLYGTFRKQKAALWILIYEASQLLFINLLQKKRFFGHVLDCNRGYTTIFCFTLGIELSFFAVEFYY